MSSDVKRSVWGLLRLRKDELTLDDLLEVVDGAGLLEDIVEAGDLDEPAHIVGEELVLDDPLGELVPFVLAPARGESGSAPSATGLGRGNGRAESVGKDIGVGDRVGEVKCNDVPAVNADAVLRHLVLALLQVGDDLCSRNEVSWDLLSPSEARSTHPW